MYIDDSSFRIVCLHYSTIYIQTCLILELVCKEKIDDAGLLVVSTTYVSVFYIMSYIYTVATLDQTTYWKAQICVQV